VPCTTAKKEQIREIIENSEREKSTSPKKWESREINPGVHLGRSGAETPSPPDQKIQKSIPGKGRGKEDRRDAKIVDGKNISQGVGGLTRPQR